MNISTDEQTRRRKVVESARWSSRMERHCARFPKRIVLDALWITDNMTRDERNHCLNDVLKSSLAARGH